MTMEGIPYSPWIMTETWKWGVLRLSRMTSIPSFTHRRKGDYDFFAFLFVFYLLFLCFFFFLPPPRRPCRTSVITVVLLCPFFVFRVSHCGDLNHYSFVVQMIIWDFRVWVYASNLTIRGDAWINTEMTRFHVKEIFQKSFKTPLNVVTHSGDPKFRGPESRLYLIC